MKKQVLACLLSCLLCLGGMAVPSAAAEEAFRVTTVIAPVYEDVNSFTDGYATVKQNGLWGLIDETGHMVIAPQYAWMGMHSEGLMLAAKPSNLEGYYADYWQMYLVDLSGREVMLTETVVLSSEMEASGGDTYALLLTEAYLEQNYNSLLFHDGVLVVAGRAYAADGRQIRAKNISATVGKNSADAYYCDAYAIGPCVDGLIPMQAVVSPYSGGRPFLMDKAGNIVQVIDYPAEIAIEQYDNGAAIRAPEFNLLIAETVTYVEAEPNLYRPIYRYGLMNRDGSWVVEPVYEDYLWIPATGRVFADGIWVVSQNGFYGALDSSGRVIIPVIYDRIGVFAEGMAVITQDGRCVYTDKIGALHAIPGLGTEQPRVTKASRFCQGLAAVYDEAAGQAYLIQKGEDGSLQAVPGSEKLPIQLYFPSYQNAAETGSIRNLVEMNKPLMYRENGLWGFMMLQVEKVPEPGTPMGDVLYTDILAYIDDKPIRSYNIAGNTYIVVEDLSAYGFGVQWIAEGSGKLVVSTTRTATPDGYTTTYVPEKNTHPAGSVAMPYLYTNITAWLGDKQVTGYNIGGLTCIGMDDLAAVFATNYVWDGVAGALKLYTHP